MNLDSYLAAVHDDAGRVATCAVEGDLTAPVAACPGWTLRDLVVHLGGVHRWATHAIQGAGAPAIVTIPTPDADATGEELSAWIGLGAGVLADVLATTSPDADTWHPFPVEQKAWVWSRRQAHETMMHRWDAEVAVSGSSSIETPIAVDGIEEFFHLALPRILVRQKVDVPESSLHVHCTDDDLGDDAGEWIVWNDDGKYAMERAHRRGDAALRGHADDILLVLMGRAGCDRLDIVGDEAAVSAWLDLPGL